jgi:hypothetical protein
MIDGMHPGPTMTISPTIPREIQRRNVEINRLPAAAAPRVCPPQAERICTHGLKIEALTIGNEQPGSLRARLDAAWSRDPA